MRLTRVGARDDHEPLRAKSVDEARAECRTAEGMADRGVDGPDDALHFDEQLPDLAWRRTVADGYAVTRQFERERLHSPLEQRPPRAAGTGSCVRASRGARARAARSRPSCARAGRCAARLRGRRFPSRAPRAASGCGRAGARSGRRRAVPRSSAQCVRRSRAAAARRRESGFARIKKPARLPVPAPVWSTGALSPWSARPARCLQSALPDRPAPAGPPASPIQDRRSRRRHRRN